MRIEDPDGIRIVMAEVSLPFTLCAVTHDRRYHRDDDRIPHNSAFHGNGSPAPAPSAV
jgi:hypothetical protein